MYRIVQSSEDIFGMSNLRGNQVVHPTGLPFSFYFSTKVSHGIRVKVVFNPAKLSQSSAGVLELHGAWKFTPGPDDAHVSRRKKQVMLDFFKYNKVLFAAVWEGVLQEDIVQDYFRGLRSFENLVENLDISEDLKCKLSSYEIHNCADLEAFVRQHNCFNMND